MVSTPCKYPRNPSWAILGAVLVFLSLGLGCLSAGLPDLTLDVQDLASSLSISDARSFRASDCELDLDHQCISSPGIHTLLEFDQTVVNTGTADLILPDVPPNFGDADPTGFYLYSACHVHYHWENFVEYSLMDGDGAVVYGHKASWCLLDVIPNHPYYNDSLPHYNASHVSSSPQYRCTNMGIGIGWADIYRKGSSCQYVQLDVPAGPYTLRVEINPNDTLHPERRIEELNYDNNVAEFDFILYCGNFMQVPVEYSFEDPIANNHTLSTLPYVLGDNDWFNISLPGMRWFCKSFDQLYVYSNGFVSFAEPNSTSPTTQNGSIVPPQSVAPLYGNWNTSGGVYYHVEGVSPDRTVYITWMNMSHSSADDDTYAFQIVFQETQELVTMRYQSVPNDSSSAWATGICSALDGDCTGDTFGVSHGSASSWSRLDITTSNAYPIAQIIAPSTGSTCSAVLFDGSSSYDPEDKELNYMWTFGDAEDLPSLEESPEYLYQSAGTYNVTLRVSDSFHQSLPAIHEIIITDCDQDDPEKKNNDDDQNEVVIAVMASVAAAAIVVFCVFILSALLIVSVCILIALYASESPDTIE